MVENWWINALGDETKRIKYIVAALYRDEDEEDVEIIHEVEEQIIQMKYE